MRMTWRQWTGLWKAKGHKIEGMEAALKNREGYSRSSLSKLSKKTQEADPELAAFVWGLETRPRSEGDFELYWRGLASLGVEVPPELLAKLENPPPPRVDAKELADGIAPRLEAVVSKVTGSLDAVLSSVGGKLDALSSSLRGKLEALALTVGNRLDGAETKVETVNKKLDVVNASLEDQDAKLDIIDHKLNKTNDRLDKGTRQLLVAIWGMGVLVAGALFTLAVVLASARSRDVPAPAPATVSAPAAPPVTKVVVNVSSGLVEDAVRAARQAAFNAMPPSFEPVAEDMGEKKVPENWIPQEPFPFQKRAPCDATLYEVEINDGCWVGVLGAKPPCGRLYRYENACYRPIAADPKKPITEPHK